MTKKFVLANNVHSDLPKEFLIPDVFNKTNSLIGIQSGKSYSNGLIVYTGVDLDTQIVLEKLSQFKKVNFLRRKRVKLRLNEYLKQIMTLKIGDEIELNKEGNLIKRSKV